MGDLYPIRIIGKTNDEVSNLRHSLIAKKIKFESKRANYLKNHPGRNILLTDPPQMIDDFCEFYYDLEKSNESLYDSANITNRLGEIVNLPSDKKRLSVIECNKSGLIDLNSIKANALTPEFLDEIVLRIIYLYYNKKSERLLIKSSAASKSYSIVFSSGMRLDDAAKYSKIHMYDSYLKEVIDGIYGLGNHNIPITILLEGLACGGGLEIALNIAYNQNGLVMIDKDCSIGLPELRKGFIPGAGGIPLGLKIFGIKNIVAMLIGEIIRFSELPDQNYHNGFIFKDDNILSGNLIEKKRIVLDDYNMMNLSYQINLLQAEGNRLGLDFSECIKLIQFCVENPKNLDEQKKLEFQICQKLFSNNKVVKDLIKMFGSEDKI